MTADILKGFGIEYFGAVPVSACKVGNERLYSQLPENCYAVFCLFPYYSGAKNVRLAAFAAAPDYHIFAKTVFSEVESHIREKYGDVFVRGYADHSPLEERHGAASAGLGIIGRHGLLINEKYSSFVCIGEFVCALTADQLKAEGIDVRVAEIKYCEGCGLCDIACPGNCIMGDKTTCLSAISQKKGELTEDECTVLRRSGVVWGCDVCQLSCPHSEGMSETPIEFFRQNVIGGDFDEIISLSDDDYKKYTFSYRKRNVMMRNISIVRGDSDDN